MANPDEFLRLTPSGWEAVAWLATVFVALFAVLIAGRQLRPAIH